MTFKRWRTSSTESSWKLFKSSSFCPNSFHVLVVFSWIHVACPPPYWISFFRLWVEDHFSDVHQSVVKLIVLMGILIDQLGDMTFWIIMVRLLGWRATIIYMNCLNRDRSLTVLWGEFHGFPSFMYVKIRMFNVGAIRRQNESNVCSSYFVFKHSEVKWRDLPFDLEVSGWGWIEENCVLFSLRERCMN